jgi:AraC-like DNA-binding protein
MPLHCASKDGIKSSSQAKFMTNRSDLPVVPADDMPAGDASADGFDVLTDVMDQVRLEGMVYFSAELHAPWGIAIDRRGRTPFYAVTAGDCEILLEPGGPAHRMRTGDFALLPNAAAHVVRSGPGAIVVPFDDWHATHPMHPDGSTVHAGRGASTCVTGGFFSVAAIRTNPLFGALPPLILLRGDDPAVVRWLQPTLAFIHAEAGARLQGGRTVLRRMADVLFIQAVRIHAAQQHGAASWLRGLAEPRVAHALALIHARYAQPWTLEALAREAGASRTLLAVRFRALVGETPMNYLARWRVTRAANRLRAEPISLERLAEQVGFGSVTVFSRAFRRHMGMTPGKYRHTQFGPGPHATQRG